MNLRPLFLVALAALGLIGSSALATSDSGILRGVRLIIIDVRVMSADADLRRLGDSQNIESNVLHYVDRALNSEGKRVIVSDPSIRSKIPPEVPDPAVVEVTVRVDLAWAPPGDDKTKIVGAVAIVFQRESQLFPSPEPMTFLTASPSDVNAKCLEAAIAQIELSLVAPVKFLQQ